MKQSMNLSELARELRCQALQKKDYIVDTRSLEIRSQRLPAISCNHGKVVSTLRMQPSANIPRAMEYSLSENAHRQIAARLNIPWAYYSAMYDQSPELLDRNVNHWLQSKPEKRMIRTLDRSVRAFLSDRYRRLDNYDLAESVLPILAKMRNTEVISCDLSPEKMYIKVINKDLQREVLPGDVVQCGIVISNSEVGLGSLRVEPLVFRLVCTNGLIARDFSQRRYHVGRAAQNDVDVYELYSDETLQADDKAFFLKVQDTVRAAVDKSRFDVIVNRLQDTTSAKLQGNPVAAVELLGNKMYMSSDEQGGVLRHLIEGGNLSAYGVINAVTHYSHEVVSYERATDFERMGGQLLALGRAEWNDILTAA